MRDLAELLKRFEDCRIRDRRLEDEVWIALGGSFRVVTGLDLNGRTTGSRVPFDREGRKRSRVPAYTNHPEARRQTINLLRTLIEDKTDAD